MPKKYKPAITKNAYLEKKVEAIITKIGSLAMQLMYGFNIIDFIFKFFSFILLAAIVDIVLQPNPKRIIYTAFPLSPNLAKKPSKR